MTTHVCSKCKQTKPAIAFGVQDKSSRKWRCRECNRKITTERKAYIAQRNAKILRDLRNHPNEP